MTASLRALLTSIIDYAGMFPPAQLPMEQAIRNYARYRTEPESWMLGKFICPAARLNELSPYVDELFRDGPALEIAALGRGERDQASFLIGLKQDLMDIEAFRVRHETRVTVNVLETKIPLPQTGSTNQQVVEAARGVLHSQTNSDLRVYYEQGVAGAIQYVAGFDQGVGHKVRCGGLTAEAFPSVAYLTNVIAVAPELRVPLKFTAGLHHPIRRYDVGVKTKMYGFLNVFGAGVFAANHELNADQIRAILEDEDPKNFSFSDDRFSWRDVKATIPQIESARRNNVISFGSCSFDEPRDDLRALGWL